MKAWEQMSANLAKMSKVKPYNADRNGAKLINRGK
jgi:hypothetical protein